MGRGAVFSNCNNLKEVVVASQLLGTNAFSSCVSLTSIDIRPSGLSLCLNCFYACSALKSITIPSHIKTIPEQAFMYCSALENVTLSEGVESIGTSAFLYCSVKEIGDAALSSYVEKSVTFHGPAPMLMDSANCDCWVSNMSDSFVAYVPKEYYEQYAAIAIGTEANNYLRIFGYKASLVTY